MVVYIDYKFLLQTSNKRLLVKDESHIRPTGVQTPDTERVSAHKNKRGKGERNTREKGENIRDVVCLKAL